MREREERERERERERKRERKREREREKEREKEREGGKDRSMTPNPACHVLNTDSNMRMLPHESRIILTGVQICTMDTRDRSSDGQSREAHAKPNRRIQPTAIRH
jgi:hypothetical protein